MKQRRRYLAFEFRGRASRADVSRVINSLCALNPKIDRAMLKLVLYDVRSRRGLLRCGHRQVDEVKASVSGAKVIGAKGVSFKVLGVSGTMRAAKRKFLALP